MNDSDDRTEAMAVSEVYIELSRVLNVVIMPIVCVWGVIAALVCIVVFTRRQMRSSLNLYLAGLSAFDLVLLSMGLIIYLPMQLCMDANNSPKSATCVFFWNSARMTFPLSLIAQTGSVWTCVAVTVDRFLAVNYPLHSKIWCTPRRAMIILLIITISSIVYRIPAFFELTFGDEGMLVPTELRDNILYKKWYITYSYALFIVAIPWTVMITLNIHVVATVHRAYGIRRSLQTNNAREERDRSASRCTVMALAMIVTFIVFNALAAVNNILESFELLSQRSPLIPIGNLLVCLNSASNIVVYSLFGRRFRQMCLKMICMHLRSLPIAQTLVSEWERETQTRRTSVEPSIGLLSAQGSRRYSKRVSLRLLDANGSMNGGGCSNNSKRMSCNQLLPEHAILNARRYETSASA